MNSRLYIQFAENGNIRKWQSKPFEGGAEYVAASVLAAECERIETYFARQIEWSRETFGPALRTKGIIDHIRKELKEIDRDPHDLSEWIDVVILAMDGFWRHGGKPEDVMPALLAKQRKNMARVWPDWRTMSADSAIEHDRTHDEPVTVSYKSDVADSATTEPDPVAYGEDIGGKIVSVRLDKSTHCIVPLYRRR